MIQSTKTAVPALVPAMARTLKTSDSAVVPSAAAAELGTMDWRAKAAARALVDALNDVDLKVRLAAVRSLGSIGSGAKSAVPILIAALGYFF
jgi:HEAT repeat protein